MAAIRAWWLCLFGMTVFLGSPGEAATAEVVRMGFHVKIVRDLSRSDVQSSLSLWGRDLSQKYAIPTVIAYYEDIADLKRDFEKGGINFVIAGGMDIARHFAPSDLAEGFRGALEVDHTLLLMTHRDSQVNSLAQLAGKRVALLQDDELSRVYLETLCLQEHGKECRHVFRSIESVANSNQLMMRLFFRKADLVLTKRAGYEVARELNPQIGQVSQELTHFPIKHSYYGFFHRRIPPAYRQHGLRQIEAMHREPRGRQILQLFKIGRLETASPEELQPFYALLERHEELQAGTRTRRSP